MIKLLLILLALPFVILGALYQFVESGFFAGRELYKHLK